MLYCSKEHPSWKSILYYYSQMPRIFFLSKYIKQAWKRKPLWHRKLYHNHHFSSGCLVSSMITTFCEINNNLLTKEDHTNHTNDLDINLNFQADNNRIRSTTLQRNQNTHSSPIQASPRKTPNSRILPTLPSLPSRPHHEAGSLIRDGCYGTENCNMIINKLREYRRNFREM